MNSRQDIRRGWVPSQQFFALTFAAVVALAATVGRVGAGHSPPRPRGGPGSPAWSSIIYPTLPPPVLATLLKYRALMTSYLALETPKPCTFMEWLVRNGVTDAEELRLMLLLARLDGI